MQLADQTVDMGVCHRGVGVGVLTHAAPVSAETVEDDVASLVALLNQFVLQDVHTPTRVLQSIHHLLLQLLARMPPPRSRTLRGLRLVL